MKIRVLYAKFVNGIGRILVVVPAIALFAGSIFEISSKLYVLGMIAAIVAGAFLQAHADNVLYS